MAEKQEQKGKKVNAEEDAGEEARDSTQKREKKKPKKIEKNKKVEKEEVKKGWELGRTPVKKIKDGGAEEEKSSSEGQKRNVEVVGERQAKEEEEK